MDIKTHRDKLYITDSEGWEVRLTVEEVADDYVHPDTLIVTESTNKKPLTLEDLQAQIDALKQGA